MLVHVNSKQLLGNGPMTPPTIDGISREEMSESVCNCGDFCFTRDDDELIGDVGLWVEQ